MTLEETVESRIVLVAPKDRKPAWPARTFLEFMDKVFDAERPVGSSEHRGAWLT